uniref:Uncharacterized protein n=1 Tax=Sinocyclocheilus grahami TaxID=75366 RepID=A0A672JYP8_SINGR
MLIFREPEVSAVFSMNHELSSELPKNSYYNLQCLHMTQKNKKERAGFTERNTRELYLNLLPDSSFLAPGGTFQYDTISSSAFLGGDFRRCFYSGDINADRNSYAALSLCGGVRGAFSYNGMEYLIERRSTNTALGMISEDAEKTHIIRRRRHLHAPNSTSRCGVTSSLNQGVVESLGKYKHVKGHTRNLTESLLKNL